MVIVNLLDGSLVIEHKTTPRNKIVQRKYINPAPMRHFIGQLEDQGRGTYTYSHMLV